MWGSEPVQKFKFVVKAAELVGFVVKAAELVC